MISTHSVSSSPPPPPPPIPVPSIQSLSLLLGLYHPENHTFHIDAIRIRDDALSCSIDSYNILCIQLLYIVIGCDHPCERIVSQLTISDIELWKNQTNDPISVNQLIQYCTPTTTTLHNNTNNNIRPEQQHVVVSSTNPWISFGQLAGLVLKNALVRPPSAVPTQQSTHQVQDVYSPHSTSSSYYCLNKDVANHMKELLLLYGLKCHHKELRDVVSTIISSVTTTQIKHKKSNQFIPIQPELHLRSWPNLLPSLLSLLQQYQQQQQQQHVDYLQANHTTSTIEFDVVDGCLSTLLKMIEDGPNEFTIADMDVIVPVVLGFLSSKYCCNNNNITNSNNNIVPIALQIIYGILIADMIPNTLVLHFDQYLHSLSELATTTTTTKVAGSTTSTSTSTTTTTTNYTIQKWVCRSIVTLLELRTEYIRPHIGSIGTYILETTNSLYNNNNNLHTVQTDSNNNHNNNNNEYSMIEDVALEACEFWFAFANLDDTILTSTSSSTTSSNSNSTTTVTLLDEVGTMFLPQLIPILVRNMVYSTEKQQQFIEEQQQQSISDNERRSTLRTTTDDDDNHHHTTAMKPIFHKSRNYTSTNKKKIIKGNNKNNNYHNKSGTDDVRDDNEEVDDDDDEDDDDDDDDDENSTSGTNEWTLRKCSAATLEALGGLYGGDTIVPLLLPALHDGLIHTNPWIQEASILAFGAVADGCYDTITTQKYIDQIYPYLLQILATTTLQQQPPTGLLEQQSTGTGTASSSIVVPSQLKSIAAWTIGQYSMWAIEQVQMKIQEQLLQQMITVFVTCINTELDRKVQVSCCVTFGTIIEAASNEHMAPYLEYIYTNLSNGALQWYTGRSLLVLFDLFGILADCCSTAVHDQYHLLQLYMKQLLHYVDTFVMNNPCNRRTLPLLECLASIVLACKMNYQNYSIQTYEYAMYVIEQVSIILLQQQQSSSSLLSSSTTGDDAVAAAGGSGSGVDDEYNNENDEEDYDPIICAVDLIDALIEGLGTNFVSLLSCSVRYDHVRFTNVLLVLLQQSTNNNNNNNNNNNYTNYNVGVQMSAWAIVGDLARNTPMVLEPILVQVIQHAIDCTDPTLHVSSYSGVVSLNAIWALGEICIICQGRSNILEPFAPRIVQNIIAILVGNGTIVSYDNEQQQQYEEEEEVVHGLIENACTCLGRLAKVQTQFVSERVSIFLIQWCDGMSKIIDINERRDAYEGLIHVLYANPQAIHVTGISSSSMSSLGTNNNHNNTNAIEGTILSILFAIVTWHIPTSYFENNEFGTSSTTAIRHWMIGTSSEYPFQPFPSTEHELGLALIKLVHAIKESVGTDTWYRIEKKLPVNVRRLLREAYHL